MAQLLVALFLASMAIAAPKKTAKADAAPKELWSLSFEKAKPEAVFFDVSKGALYVSLAEGDTARLDLVSLAGKLEQTAVNRGKGKPGPMRVFDDQLFWIVGQQVLSFGVGGTVPIGTVPADLGNPVDIAVGRGRAVHVGTTSGTLYRLQSGEGTRVLTGQPISGLFLLENTLYILRGTALQTFALSPEADIESKVTPLCSKPCQGLERSSSGAWISVQKDRLVEISGTKERTLLKSGQAMGRPAYVYRKDPKDDFFVVPFPEEGVIRAYRSY